MVHSWKCNMATHTHTHTYKTSWPELHCADCLPTEVSYGHRLKCHVCWTAVFVYCCAVVCCWLFACSTFSWIFTCFCIIFVCLRIPRRPTVYPGARPFRRGPVKPFARGPIRPSAWNPVRPFARGQIRPSAWNPVQPFARGRIRPSASGAHREGPVSVSGD